MTVLSLVSWGFTCVSLLIFVSSCLDTVCRRYSLEADVKKSQIEAEKQAAVDDSGRK